MENAVDALKMAFAAIVFVIAVTVAFTAFSQARWVADLILYTSDRTNYEERIGVLQNADVRTVGIETVISSIKRYRIENEDYSVVIKDKDGEILKNGTTELVFDLAKDSTAGIPQDEQIEQLMKGLEYIQRNCNDWKFTETYRTEMIKRYSARIR